MLYSPRSMDTQMDTCSPFASGRVLHLFLRTLSRTRVEALPPRRAGVELRQLGTLADDVRPYASDHVFAGYCGE